MMNPFKFLQKNDRKERFNRLMEMLHEIDRYEIPMVGIGEIVAEEHRGLLHDFHENGLNPRGYPPYEYTSNGNVYLSEVANFTKNELTNVYSYDPEYVYMLYAVLRPATETNEQEVIELMGAINIFPIFVLENPDERYLYEIIKRPRV